MPDLETKLPEALQTQRTLVLHADLAARQELGPTKHGVRYVVPIVGGQCQGSMALNGEVLPGGADWQLLRQDGVLEIDARYTVRLTDGTLIHVRNRGLAVRATASDPVYVRTTPELEAPSASPHAWLNRTMFVGTLELIAKDRVCVAMYRVL